MSAAIFPLALRTLTPEMREQEILTEREVMARWPLYALLRHRECCDEELWSLRDGWLGSTVEPRIAAEQRLGFTPTHGRTEERLWGALLAAARACRSQELGGSSASSQRRELALAIKRYRRAGTPPRAAIPAAVKRRLITAWEAGGRACGICGQAMGQDDERELDHIRPVSLGGGDEAENLRVAHRACNGLRGAWYLEAGADLGDLQVRLEPAHPALGAAFACRICGVPTRGYVDVPDLPLLRLCEQHRDRATIAALLAGYGIGAAALAQATLD